MDGNMHTYKARLIAKGFTQTYKVDYEETYSLVTDIKTIRILIAIAAYYDYEIWQMDVKTAFLNGHLNEYVYMVQPEGFVNPKHPRRYGFTQNPDEPCVYKRASGSIVFLILYVYDILLMGNNIPMLQDVKSWLGKCFAMKDLGEAAYILGIKIYRDRSRRLIGLSQNAYIDKILKRFKMDTSKRGTIPMQPNVDLRKSQGPSTPTEVKRMKGVPYASVVGSIMYVVRCTRPDVANTKDMFLVYGGDSTTELGVTCYTDASWETDRDDLQSQTGFVFVMNGGAVDWKSSKQSTTAMSSMEAEYIAAAEAAMEAIWIHKFISGLGVVPSIDKPMDMYCDNTSAITIADEPGVQKERLAELERDNRRLRGTMSVESQRVDRLQRGMSRMQRELRQMRRLRFYDRMPNTRSGASMTHEEFEELVARRVAEELEAREAARTLEPLNENGDELEGENGGNGNGNGGNGNGNGGNGNGNGGNGNGNGGNGNGNGGNGNFQAVARDALPRLLEVQVHIISQEQTICVEACICPEMVELMKLMTEVYCPRNEIQKMETELWNLAVKGNDLTAYTQGLRVGFFVLEWSHDEEDSVERVMLQGCAGEIEKDGEKSLSDNRGQATAIQ
ncbi:retrotransposon protein, putative, ty1-copia subclass [Tanacetum coccineum]